MAKQTAAGVAEPVARGRFIQVCLGLVWLGATTYAAHAAITANGQNVSGSLGAVLAALPGVVAAMVVTSAAIGAAAGSRLRGAGGRLIAGLVLGVLFGVAAAVGIWSAYGDRAAIGTLAITIGAASVVGGALAVLPSEVLLAGLWGTTWVFLAGVIFGVLQPNLLPVLGQSLVIGVAAGLSALRLRAKHNFVLWCLVGGALPGLVLLGAALLTKAAAGSAVARLVEPSDAARLRYALIVLIVGGLIATLAGALTSLRSRLRRRYRLAGVEAFHQGLARIGLQAAKRYGFALAGGYAVKAAGLLKRSTHDIDLFTVWPRRDEFETAVRAVVDAYRATGLTVQAERRHDTFTRLTVSDGVQTATVELGVDQRQKDPVQTSIGPVLHPDDVVANKMRALYERAHASDFIDIDTALQSGRYDRLTLLQLGERSDISFDTNVFANVLAQAQLLDADSFAQYGVVGTDLDGLRHRFALWRANLVNEAETTS